MAGKPGTPRYGRYPNYHDGKPAADGTNTLTLQSEDSEYLEQHFLYDPSQRAREMGTTLGQAPQKMAGYQHRLYEAPANHDAFEGGDAHLSNVDERKALDNTIFSIKCEYADDQQHNWSSSERTA
jgi:hypothetical protein